MPFLLAGGCVRRTITVTSDPDGALVYLNDQEVGRTPVEVDFIFYGDYDVRVLKEGYEPLTTVGEASPPLWDNIPFDLVAEAVPGEPRVNIAWHYELTPVEESVGGLLERAASLRHRMSERDHGSNADTPGLTGDNSPAQGDVRQTGETDEASEASEND